MIKFRKRKGPVASLRSWYFAQGVLGRALLLLGPLALYVAVVVKFIPDSIVVSLVAYAVFAISAYTIVVQPKKFMVVLMYVLAILLIPSSGVMVASAVPVEQQVWTLMVWMVVQTSALAIFHLWCYRHPKGRTWLTLGMALFAMYLSSFFVFSFTASAPAATTIPPVLGFIVVMVRTLRLRPVTPETPDHLELDGIAKSLSKFGFVPTIRQLKAEGEKTPMVAAVNKKGQLVMLTYVDMKNLALGDKGEPTWNGKLISGWLAQEVEEARRALPSRVPFVRVVVVSGSPDVNRSKTLTTWVTHRSKNQSFPVVLMSDMNVGRTLRSLVESSSVHPVTRKQLDKVSAKLAAAN